MDLHLVFVDFENNIFRPSRPETMNAYPVEAFQKRYAMGCMPFMAS
jgi:hypothetical protein